jgi:hypothetical protein
MMQKLQKRQSYIDHSDESNELCLQRDSCVVGIYISEFDESGLGRITLAP